MLPLLDEVQEFEGQYPEGFRRFTDLSSVEGITLSAKDVHTISQRREHDYKGPAVLSAIYALDPCLFGMCRMYAAMMFPSPIEVGVFYSIAESAEWLKVEPKELAIPDS